MNPTKECVVVGVDGSPGSHAALRWAAHYAHRVGGEVRAVTAWRIPPPFADKIAEPVDEQETHARTALESALTDVRRAVPDCAVEASVQRGVPSDVLLENARQAHLAVFGDTGRGALAGLLVGSVVREFLRHAPCPVVLVRADQSTS
ncbi:universal stress protein [Saccharopolyspora erythraea]|uniref:universal stress protein n=1 Tax=Saccharopolyspora erythraea TaxID=1836 RepID=UPI001BA8B604|nr:universal stress protein [Saccharopolyspora erythraea]